MMRLLTLAGIVLLGTLAWIALWSDISWANALVGFGLSVATLGAQRRRSEHPLDVEPIALGRLLLAVLIDLGRSTVSVAREVVTPTDYTEEAVIAIAVDPAAMDHALLLTTAITLTPGTAIIELDRERATIYLHVLHARERSEITAHVHQLADLAVAAFPSSPSQESAI